MNAKLFLGFLAFIAVLRLAELVVSKRNAVHHQDSFQPRPEPLFKWMVLLHSCMYVLLPLELYWRKPVTSNWLTWLALGMTLCTLGMRLWTLFHIGKSWNVRILGGKDYPICNKGPYRWIRHPNYAVVIMELFWIPLIAGLWISCLILTLANAWVLRIRIKHEESVLFENDVWVSTMASKPRFFPKFF